MTEKVSLLQPFKIGIDPMDRLLLVNFEKDPDSVYLGFEPQVFDDSIHGKGHLVIGWRIDGKVDVYYQPGLLLKAEHYDIAGKGLNNMIQTTFSKANYEIDDLGVQACYLFKDIENRSITIRIIEKNNKVRKPFGLLAPMGDAAEKPSSLPLVYLHDFYFVRKNQTEIEIIINNRKHRPDELPFPIDMTKMYFIRYSPRPLIVTLNTAFSGKVSSVNIEPHVEIYNSEDHKIHLTWENTSPVIKKIIRKNEIHQVTLEFEDAFPNLHSLPKNITRNGKFIIKAHPSTGIIRGQYFINNSNKIKLVMIPNKGWKPRTSKISLWFLYSIAGIFKNWPKSYKWTAILNPQPDGSLLMDSKWERINTK